MGTTETTSAHLSLADLTKAATSDEGRPLITLAIRHFNNGPFVATALESAFAQTYSPLEIVFVDDASTDGGFEIAERVAARYTGPHRVVLSRSERNRGVGAQTMRVLDLSGGEIIVLLDADDIALPGRCQKVYEAFRDGGPTLLGVVSYFDLIDPGGGPFTGVPPANVANRPRVEDWTAEMLARDSAGPSGAASAFRRTVFERGISFEGLRQSEDLLAGFRCLVLGRITTIPEVLVLRRVHLDNISGPIRPSWSGRDLADWYANVLRAKILVRGVMRRDLDEFVRAGLIPATRALQLDREVRIGARGLKLLRVAPRLSLWRRCAVYFALRGIDIPWRQSLRLALQALAPSLAMMFLRQNPIFRQRAAMLPNAVSSASVHSRVWPRSGSALRRRR